MDFLSISGILIASIVALIVVSIVHPQIVKFAKKKNVVDNPDARKLQRSPIPVMGGVAVFFGIISGFCTASFFFDVAPLLAIFVTISIKLCVGVTDDLSDLSPWFRFAIEIAISLLLVFWSGISLNDFQGLWGIGVVPIWLSIPLTIIAIVGIINATNMVDGVDGLSSGYCISASVAFAILFEGTGYTPMLLMCSLSIGALLPFFLHNVFGKKSKMFIGDGGSLMMGVIMSTYVVFTITSGGPCERLANIGIGLVPISLAIMCVPVFDCLRVMVMRILRGTSPFRPDKTHMHHLFIELGFSHFGTTVSVLSLNIIVVLLWLLSYKLGASIDVQFYVVMASGLLLTAGFYKFMRMNINNDTAIYKFTKRVGAMTHIENHRIWLALQKMVDFKH